GEDEQERRGAAFHVDGAAAVQAALGDVARPGIALPGGAVANREDIEMAVQQQMPARPFDALEAGDDVGIVSPGRLGAMGDAFLVQEGAEEIGGLARVARWIGGVDAREALQELDLAVALGVEEAQQLGVGGQGGAGWGPGPSCTMPPSLIPGRRGAPPMA